MYRLNYNALIEKSEFYNHFPFLVINRIQTCSKQMPGSLGHEEHNAKIFALWVHSYLF